MSKDKKLYTSTFRFEGKKYFCRSAKSQREADKKAVLKKAELEAGSQLIGGNITLKYYAEKWLETYKLNVVSDAVYKAYRSRIENYIIPECGNLPVKKIRPTNLQKILNQQAGKSKDHCSKLRHTIQQIFEQARRDKICNDNPAECLTLPKAENGTHRSITDDERRATLEVAETHPFGLFVRVLLYCGLRPQEAAALRWEDIDQINHRLNVRRAVKSDGSIGSPKSAAGVRTIPIPATLWEELQKGIPEKLNTYIFLDSKGERLSKTAIKRRWQSFRRELDIALGAELERDTDGAPVLRYGCSTILHSVVADDLTLYCYRHTYCTDLEAAGVSINVAKYLMGHSSIELTAKIYSHMREDILAEAALKIDLSGATAGATDNTGKTGIIREIKAGHTTNKKRDMASNS